jgi:hypothetical protein
MQVDGHIECFHAGPKVPYRLLVEVLGGVHVANVPIAVDHRPLEAELRDGALQLVTSGAHVLERHSSEAGESGAARSSFIRFAVSTAIARSGMP